MTLPSSSLRFALAAFALLGCQTKTGPSLPPTQGEGAPLAPEIPKLETLAPAVSATHQSGERTGTGSLQPIAQADLGPKETGVITSITVDEGDRVKKGQVLFRLDAAQAQLAVAQARAGLSAAKVQHGTAKLDYERTQTLRARGSISEDALDQAKARFEATRSAVDQAEAALGLAQRHLANMVVTSPIDGIVAEKRMHVGETATLMPPSIVLVVQNIDTLELRARLPEIALRSVHEQSEIEARFPALDETRRVRVARISPNVDPRTRTIEIVAEIDNRDHRLKAGMLAEVAFAQASAKATSTKAPLPATTAEARAKRPKAAHAERAER